MYVSGSLERFSMVASTGDQTCQISLVIHEVLAILLNRR
jgi:hypothetical protein